jgi:hypothetical protein
VDRLTVPPPDLAEVTPESTRTTEEPQPAAQRRARGVRWHLSSKRALPFVVGVVLGVAAVLLGTVLVTSTPVRSLLRESFTRLPDHYTELYFTQAPSVRATDNGPIVHAAVTIVWQAPPDEADARYTVRATLPMSAATTTVTVAPGKPQSVVFELPLRQGAAAVDVDVNLVGRTENVHYRILGQAK